MVDKIDKGYLYLMNHSFNNKFMFLISNYASKKIHTLYIYFDGHMLFNNDDVDVTDN